MPSSRTAAETHYEIRRQMTGRAHERQRDTVQGWHQLTTQRDRFDTLADAVEFLRTTYGTCKRVPMYRDDPGGEAHRSGLIYCTRDQWAAKDGWPYLQDWTEIIEVTESIVEPPWRADK